MLLVHAVGEAYAVLHEGVLDELAAPAADLSRLLEGRSVAVGEEDEVRAHAPRELHDALIEVLAAAVAGELGAHLAGLLEVEVRHVHHEDAPGIIEPRAEEVAYAYGAAADDDDVGVAVYPAVAHGVHAVGDGLDEGALLVGEGVRELDDGLLGGDDVLAQAAAPGAGAEDLLVRADVVEPVIAVPAVAAAVVGLDGDAVADLELGDALAYRHHVTGHLVAGDYGRDAEGVQAVDGVDLAAAYAAVAYSYLYVVGLLNLRFRHVVAELGDADGGHITSSHFSKSSLIKRLSLRPLRRAGWAVSWKWARCR